MKVYLKYCGGCNPLYDRSVIREKLAADFPHFTFTRSEEEADRALVICGCSRACASVGDAYSGEEACCITSLKDYEEVRNQWKKM